MNADPRLGTTVAGYRVESVVGRGGMGVVYRAEHVRLKRQAAVKVLSADLADDEAFRHRFLRESELAASLDHPNIVDIYDAGDAEGVLYLAMRYVQGLDLKTVIAREGPLDVRRTSALIMQVAAALDAAHDRGLVHRDVKPANVLVEKGSGPRQERAFLTDFGLTKRPESMSGLTNTGQFLGSVAYAAPEQFEGKPVGPRTDVYALGCLLYECLTGEVPFPRDAEAAVMYAHLRQDPPRPTAARPHLPPSVDGVVAKAMAKDPDERFESAGALAKAMLETSLLSVEVRPKILVVDDVATNVRLLEAVLTNNGYDVTTASTGHEALEKVVAELPALVLLDIHMPGMDGYDVCRRIRSDPSTRFLPVVMITSSDSEVRVNAIEAEADDFITKPFDQQELLGRVRSLVRIKRYHDTIESQASQLAELNASLENRVADQVRELDRLAQLRRFLSPTLADVIVEQGEQVLESHRREIAVMCAALRGWAAFSVATEPEEVMGVVNEYHAAMGALVTRFEATVGWIAGDGLMVWFNDPIPCANPSARAVSMAVAVREATTELTSKWRKRGHSLDHSIGVAVGYATLGRFGFDGRYDYGAVGTVVSLASRLCDDAEPAQILVSERVVAELEGIVDAQSAGARTLKGFDKPVPSFSIVNLD